MQFQALGLSPVIVKSVRALGFDTPTPIQREAIPLVLRGHDLMGLAQTGTGKTAAFGLPLMHHLLASNVRPAPKTVRSLILAPTRELVNQIATHLRDFVRGTPLRIASVVGGASINIQTRDLARGTDVLVATPGRLIDLVERKAVFLDTAKFLVLDEADQMLDLGFIHALRKIANMVGTPRQTLLFSATMPKQIEELSRAYLNAPVRIEVSPPGRAVDKVRQSVHFVSQRSKADLLRKCLGERSDDLSLVFARTKRGAEKLMKHLADCGLSAGSIHGNKNQSQRDRAIKAFRSGEIRVLVATDVAARGIDIPGVSHVYNFDLPDVPESYVHRIGRTARAGADGEAVAFCGTEETHLLRDIEKLMGIRIRVASGDLPDHAAAQPARDGNGQARGNTRQNGDGRGNPQRAVRPGGKTTATPPSGGQQQRPERRPSRQEPRAASDGGISGSNGAAHSRPNSPDSANRSRPKWRRRPRKSAAA